MIPLNQSEQPLSRQNAEPWLLFWSVPVSESLFGPRLCLEDLSKRRDGVRRLESFARSPQTTCCSLSGGSAHRGLSFYVTRVAFARSASAFAAEMNVHQRKSMPRYIVRG